MKGRPITGEEFERMLAMLPKVVLGKLASPTPEQEAVRAAVVESWKYYLTGLWLSGLRLQESLLLYWDDGDEHTDRLSVKLSGRYPMFKIPAELDKANTARILPMAPEFAELILATPKEERVGRVFAPRQAYNGVPIGTACHVGRVLSAIGEKAKVKVNTNANGKVKYASAHDLRRSFGERWAAILMPKELMELMRHEDIETTMRYYVDKNAEAVAAAVWEARARKAGASIEENGEAPTSGHSRPSAQVVSQQKQYD